MKINTRVYFSCYFHVCVCDMNFPIINVKSCNYCSVGFIWRKELIEIARIHFLFFGKSLKQTFYISEETPHTIDIYSSVIHMESIAVLIYEKLKLLLFTPLLLPHTHMTESPCMLIYLI